ncbi:long-chain-fatty-acid--CoA ligase [Microbacterium sorbitolivorans]|uniref:Acyl-CoA synthetase n=1 Tax=Microbacterium sorbitolivorans TaxID=1867410 RepID=A0A367Y6G3_9MICO|nr:AMP-dependent synthetase/ligase [Microbacterium sorbitolivorans]RCK61229.1 long-chain fatty acid--CoA ligase [Microbacterium sorbitolivorans]GGF33921.1 long-chain-fatty-acid--CoA ligase [Microbacterium sorbitolivorans]
MNETYVEPLVPNDPERNISDLLVDRVRETPDRPLFAVPDGDGWKDKTSREFEDEVIALAKGFVAAGLRPGDKIGFLASTTYRWTLVDFALYYAGVIMVPVYETSSPEQIRWILSDSGSVALMVENDTHHERFAEVRGELPLIGTYWRMDEGALATLIEEGREVEDAEIERRRSLARSSDIATIIYTSGSTGRPKGCVLTHGNFVDTAENAAVALREVIDQPGASTVLFITTAHVFARFMSVLYIRGGVKTGHEPNTKNLVKTLGSFKPTLLLAVPRVFEKVYNSAEQKTQAEGKGAIFQRAAKVAIEYSRREQEGEKIGPLLALQFKLFNKLVYGKLRELMGGRVTYAVSGSAPLGPHLGYFFRGLGVKILEGYGLTETTAPASVNRPGDIQVGTVGPALPGVGIRIASDGEVEIKGVNVFREYWRNAEATEEAFDGEWFRTGDLGALDDQGRLSITGRKKEIIVTAGGKNVSPTMLEDPIRANSIVGQVVVVGDQKPFIAALVTLDPEMLPAWLKTHGQPDDLTLEQAAATPAVREEVQRAIDHANTLVSRAESIREFRILPTEWTEASGHLTPKLSIKRSVIMKDFASAVDDIYAAPGDRTSTIAIG